MTKGHRRVVTGHDAGGKAVFVADGPTPNVWEAPDGGPVFELWKHAGRPENASGFADPIVGPVTLPPPPGGSTLRIVEFAPRAAGEQPHMHRTPSLDYCYVIEGTIVAVLDDEERELSAGDVLVQRGTNHGWRNESGRPCRVLFVLIDAEPLPRSASDEAGVS